MGSLGFDSNNLNGACNRGSVFLWGARLPALAVTRVLRERPCLPSRRVNPPKQTFLGFIALRLTLYLRTGFTVDSWTA